jgi:hypothetical protein
MSRALAARLGAALFDLDTLSLPLLEANLQEDPGFKDSARYREFYRDAEYRALFDVVIENIGLGIDCIATAPFTSERADPQLIAGLRARCARAFYAVGIVISIDAAAQRRNLLARAARRDRRKLTYETALVTQAPASWDVDVSLAVSFNALSSDFDRVTNDLYERLRQ